MDRIGEEKKKVYCSRCRFLKHESPKSVGYYFDREVSVRSLLDELKDKWDTKRVIEYLKNRIWENYKCKKFIDAPDGKWLFDKPSRQNSKSPAETNKNNDCPYWKPIPPPKSKWYERLLKAIFKYRKTVGYQPTENIDETNPPKGKKK